MNPVSKGRAGRLRAGAVVVVLATTTVGAAACSSGSSSSSPPPTPVTSVATDSASACAEATALRQSLQDLQNVDIVKNGTSSLSTALSNVKDDADALAQNVNSSLKPYVTAVQDAARQLQTAVGNVASGGLTPVTDAVTSLEQSGQALVERLNQLKC